MTSQGKISAVIITHNEERNIARCLQSLRDVADEIVIVDSFSTDDTEKICTNHMVRFEKRTWIGYAEQKNYANSLAIHPYILSIDADEALSNPLRTSILNQKDKLKGAYSFNRKTNYCGKWIKHGGWYPDRKIRLFPKAGAVWTGGFVHEQLQLNESLTVSHLDGNLLHYSYYTIEEHKQRTEKYAMLGAKYLLDSGKKISALRKYSSAFARFFSMYILQLGFLDGKAGFQISRITAKGSYLKYKMVHAMQRENSSTKTTLF